MKGLEIFFPPFEKIVCDPKLRKYFVCDECDKESRGSYAVVIEKYMPENSALFLDKDKNIVAIYHKGNLVLDKIKVKKLITVLADILKGNMK